MRELLAGLVPGLPAPTVKAIVGRADGIPLYAVETVRMLVADGRLVRAQRRLSAERRARGHRGARTPLRRSSRHGSTASKRRTARFISDAAVLGQTLLQRGPRSTGWSRRCGRRSATDDIGAPRAHPARDGPALAGAWPIRVRAGADPRSGLQHTVEEGPQDAPRSGGALLRGPGHGRSRRCSR